MQIDAAWDEDLAAYISGQLAKADRAHIGACCKMIEPENNYLPSCLLTRPLQNS
jgi:hypothetical protein